MNILELYFKEEFLDPRRPSKEPPEHYVRSLMEHTTFSPYMIEYWCGPKSPDGDKEIEGYAALKYTERVCYFYDCANELLYKNFENPVKVPDSYADSDSMSEIYVASGWLEGKVTEDIARNFLHVCEKVYNESNSTT